MKLKGVITWSLVVYVVLTDCSCKRKQSANGVHAIKGSDLAIPKADSVLIFLKEKYHNGELLICEWESGQVTVYKGKKNVFDATEEIFDLHGKNIASCNYNTGQTAVICDQLDSCSVIWRISPNIWGLPGAGN